VPRGPAVRTESEEEAPPFEGKKKEGFPIKCQKVGGRTKAIKNGEEPKGGPEWEKDGIRQNHLCKWGKNVREGALEERGEQQRIARISKEKRGAVEKKEEGKGS